ILSGVVSGGLGSLAGAGATALGWGDKAIKVTKVATELGSFVPTDRVLSDVINGKKADWSPGAMARDHPPAARGHGRLQAAGQAWQYFRGETPELAGAVADGVGGRASTTGRSAGNPEFTVEGPAGQQTIRPTTPEAPTTTGRPTTTETPTTTGRPTTTEAPT